MKAVQILLPLLIGSFSAYATIECTVKARLLHRKNHRPFVHTIVLVKSIGVTTCAITDKNGYCQFDFNTSMHTGPGAEIAFYAVRKKGDTVLLKSFIYFPKSFKLIDDQQYRTTFYLP